MFSELTQYPISITRTNVVPSDGVAESVIALSLCLIKHHALKAVKEEFYAFLASA